MRKADRVMAAMGGQEKEQGLAVAALTTNNCYVIDTNLVECCH